MGLENGRVRTAGAQGEAVAYREPLRLVRLVRWGRLGNHRMADAIPYSYNMRSS